jgi:hypothetical protein
MTLPNHETGIGFVQIRVDSSRFVVLPLGLGDAEEYLRTGVWKTKE